MKSRIDICSGPAAMKVAATIRQQQDPSCTTKAVRPAAGKCSLAGSLSSYRRRLDPDIRAVRRSFDVQVTFCPLTSLGSPPTVALIQTLASVCIEFRCKGPPSLLHSDSSVEVSAPTPEFVIVYFVRETERETPTTRENLPASLSAARFDGNGGGGGDVDIYVGEKWRCLRPRKLKTTTPSTGTVAGDVDLVRYHRVSLSVTVCVFVRKRVYSGGGGSVGRCDGDSDGGNGDENRGAGLGLGGKGSELGKWYWAWAGSGFGCNVKFHILVLKKK
ncbi:hypothetical protein Acr_17g0001070 [Actinidia rufa]|uniref:Uncharacterized protein n=1 Tax=Actinidia rufa TaxID=165716 RepID=A0A7J0G183_9ERIC|nr:hypothetical protein Acr_17g0001070 [Actinidia rufa]